APSRPQGDASGASGALLAQARNERAAGSLAQATASIERALRLDPNNAELWVERGELALQTGNPAQAGAMARKALSLAGTNSTISARAQRLLQAASERSRAAPRWTSIMRDLVSERRRGRYFGHRTRLTTSATFTSLVVCGVRLHELDTTGRTYFGFALIFLIAFVARAISVYHLTFLYEPP